MTFALSITILLGAAGLGTEVASWYATKRAMQNAADLGAAGGAMFLKVNYGSGSTTYDNYAKNEAKSATAYHGYANGSSNTTVTVNIPPSTGPYASASYAHLAVEVLVSQPANPLFSGLFLSSGPTISVRSVGLVDTSNGDCLFALNPTAAQSFQINGTGNINIACGAAVDSTASANNCNNANNAKNAAAYINGSGAVTTTSLSVAGSICVTGSGSFTTTKAPADHSPPDNPYSDFSWSNLWTTVPTGTVTSFSDSSSSNGTMSPGVYSSVTINGTESLGAGTYFVEGGNFTVNGSISGTGVTIVLTSTSPGTGSNVGTFTMGNNATANLSAPTTGSNAGMVVLQDPMAPQDSNCTTGNGTNCNSFQGGPSTSIVGVVYMPNGNISYGGNPAALQTGCMQIIGDTVYWSGTPSLYVNACGGTGVTPFGPTVASLVE